MVVLLSSSFAHDQDPVGVNNCGQSVSNNQHSAVLEALSDLFLYKIVSFKVDISSCFIQNQDLCISDDGSG